MPAVRGCVWGACRHLEECGHASHDDALETAVERTFQRHRKRLLDGRNGKLLIWRDLADLHLLDRGKDVPREPQQGELF